MTGRGEPHGWQSDVTRFEKPVDDRWLLRKLAHTTIDHPPGKGCYYDEHELHDKVAGRTIACFDWEWADVDRTRLVWSAGGKLFAGHLGNNGLRDVRELYDFNPMSFEPIEAPY